MKKMISLLSLLLGLAILGTFSVHAEESFGWYCVRNREHKQPVADANMRFVEQYGGYYVDASHGDTCEDKVVYLTFDVGYENGNVAKVLDVLKEKQVMASFFVLGNFIQKNPELLCRMTEEGHLIGNHTTYHKDITKYASMQEMKQDLEQLETMYRSVTGKEMSKFFRPPEGKFNRQSLSWAQELGYSTVFWSVAYADWDNGKQPSAETGKSKLLDNAHNGAIYLLHPTSATNAQILGDVIDALRSQGYRFGSLSELCAR